MKKIIVALLLFAMMMPLALPCVGAEAEIPAPTVEDILALMELANCILDAYAGYKANRNSDDALEPIKVETDPNDTNITYAASAGLKDIVYERSVSYAMKKYFNDTFVIDVSYNIGTADELVAALENVYTTSVASAIVDRMAGERMAIKIKSGKLYLIKDASGTDAVNAYGYEVNGFSFVKNIRTDGKRASADVIVDLWSKDATKDGYLCVPVSLEYTDGGWRLSEDVIMSKLYSEVHSAYRIDENVSELPYAPDMTGEDITEEQIAWLVESTNNLFLDLISCDRNDYNNDKRYDLYISKTGSHITPYEQSSLPQYVRDSMYYKLSRIDMRSITGAGDVGTNINGKKSFLNCMSTLFSDSARDSFVEFLEKEMYSLYIDGDEVYSTSYTPDRNYISTPLVYGVTDVVDIKRNGDVAAAQLELSVKSNMSLDYQTVVIPVELVRTADGWRLAENPYGSKLYAGIEDEKPDSYRDPWPDENPVPDLSGEITKEKAAAVAQRALDVYNLFFFGEVAYIKLPEGEGPHPKRKCTMVLKYNTKGLFIESKSLLAEFGAYYCFVNPDREYDLLGRRLTSLADVDAVLGEFLNDNVASYYKTDNWSNFPMFVEDKSGRLGMFRDIYGRPSKYILDFGALKVDGDRATLEVIMGVTDDYHWYEPHIIPRTANVNFENTQDGWRISGGTMFELLYGDSYTEGSPETADATPMLWLISVISLAGACAVIRKRKTR